MPHARAPAWVAFIVVAVAYGCVAAYQIELPGVYMDAVNPDYIAVRVLNPDETRVPVWAFGGNLLLDRFPVLTSLYHGTQQLWLGLPVFWLLGTTVTSLRIAHALFALGVLAAVFSVIVRSGVDRWWAALVCIALAFDPSFVYAFRTQSYITMAPAAWLLLSVWSLQKRAEAAAPERRWTFTSGLFLGLAIFGYFVYSFYVPVLAIAALTWQGKNKAGGTNGRFLLVAFWASGIVLGLIFYILGYSLLAYELGGVRFLLQYIAQTQEALGAFGSEQSLLERLAYAWMMVEGVFHNWWHHDLIFGEFVSVPAANWKTAILIGIPAISWAMTEFRGWPQPLLRLLLGLALSFFFIGALVFGGRLGGHHYVSLLPLCYCALAIALHALVEQSALLPRLPQRGAVALVVVLLGINVAGEIREATRLRQTHGVALYSDAINHFADDLLRNSDPSDVLFTPDWGLFMPIAFLTDGTLEIVTDNDYVQAVRMACEGRRVLVALIEGDRQVRFALWQRELGADAPEIRDYRQFDGRIVFQVAAFPVSPQAQSCRGARSPPA